jgi:exportin-5
MLAVSTEKLKKTDLAYDLACNIWHDVIPIILPVLLQLVRHVPHTVRCA